MTVRAPIGLIAGAGRFPILLAAKARELGIPVVCVGVAGMADPILQQLCPKFFWLRRLSMGFVVRSFRRNGVTDWTMAGKYHKQLLFRPRMWLRMMPDWRAGRFWLSRFRRDNKDDTLLLGLVAEFERDGLHCVSALELCPELLVKHGQLTSRAPTAPEWLDIDFGWTLAREMGRLDVGQSVMIRKRACLAVEAIEGTDRCIERAGELCGRAGFVVVKVAKPDQDMRFDVPTVGPDTIETMRKAGATALAIEAGRTIIIDEPETLALADKYRMAVVARVDGDARGR